MQRHDLVGVRHDRCRHAVPVSLDQQTNVSVMPAAHLFTVLTVAGATIIASAAGSRSGSPGFL
jgi:hypothetical protein